MSERVMVFNDDEVGLLEVDDDDLLVFPEGLE